MNKPFAESCEQNKAPIFDVIAPYLKTRQSVLEIGSGTGQHALYFAEKLQHLVWHTSDKTENHAGINQWLADAKLDNVNKPLALDVSNSIWPNMAFDAAFTANTTHIMHWVDVEALFAGVGQQLTHQGIFLIYGPFNFDGQFTSSSNRQFHRNLTSRDPLSGIRSFEDLNQLAENASLSFVKDHEMPSNNRILVWEKDCGGT